MTEDSEREAGPGPAPAGPTPAPWIGRLAPVLLLTVLFAALDYAKDLVSGSVHGYVYTFTSFHAQSLAWLVWLAMTPLIVLLADRAGPDRMGWLGAGIVHGIVGAAFSLVGITLSVGLIFLLLPPRPAPWAEYYQGVLEGVYVANFAMYLACSGSVLALDYFRRQTAARVLAARASLRSAQLESALVAARLDALARQLRPHFLHNALNSMSGLIRDADWERGLRMTHALSELFEASSDLPGTLVTLGAEARLLQAYVDIEAIRFEDRLTFHLDIPASLHDALVPPLLLQPLVENAVRHGVARTADPVRVEVRAVEPAGRLLVVVENDGPDPVARAGAGIGLNNTRQRLRLAFGPSASLRLGPRPGGGARVTMDIPLSRGAAPEAPSPALQEPPVTHLGR